MSERTPPYATSVSCEIRLEAGHRLPGHEGKCRNVHGHNYRFVVCVDAFSVSLDSNGFVMDFADLKRISKEVLDAWDHAYLAQEGDVVATQLIGHGLRVVCFERPPTAEVLALEAWRRIDEKLKEALGSRPEGGGWPSGPCLQYVECWETDNFYARAYGR